VPKVHNGVQMGLKAIDESLFPLIASRLLGEVPNRLFGGVAMSRLASNHTGTRAHWQRINVVQDALSSVLRVMGM
jgi:hypothetical protein